MLSTPPAPAQRTAADVLNDLMAAMERQAEQINQLSATQIRLQDRILACEDALKVKKSGLLRLDS